MKRMKPIFTKNLFSTVRASSGGSTNRYTNIRKKPGSSRTIGPKKEPYFSLKLSSGLPSQFSQKISDTLMLLSGSTLCESQNENGPKKFQFGPRRKVPSTMSVTHMT